MNTPSDSPLLRDKGLSSSQLQSFFDDYTAGDAPIIERMAAGSPYPVGRELDEIGQRAMQAFWDSNAMYARYYPSLTRMERELVGAGVRLLHGDEHTDGTLSSGGSESILLAVKSARDLAESERGITEPEMVVPATGHPAFWKASQFLKVKLVVIALDDEYRPDLEQMKQAITSNTVIAVASAPSFTLGVVDPVDEMADIARDRGVPLHVDACVGGFFLPFLEREGYAVPPFDFRVEGVETMSLDLHKYGWAPRGVSMVLTRGSQRLAHQWFEFGYPPPRPANWYRTPGVAGSRPGANVAAAWAVMAYLGQQGYRRLARVCMDFSQRIWDTIDQTDGLVLLGQPLMPLFTYSSDESIVSLQAVAKGMEDKGWLVHKDVFPQPLIRMMQSPGHAPYVDQYRADLVEVTEKARLGLISGEGADAAYR